MTDAFRVVPASTATWEDLREVLGTRGATGRCQCQRYKLGRGESFGSFPVEERAGRLRQQADPGHPGAPTSGLVGFLGADPVGWCAVEPRSAYDACGGCSGCRGRGATRTAPTRRSGR